MEVHFEMKEIDYRERTATVPISPYDYQLLRPRQFRVLEVLPSDNHEAPIVCSLKHYDLHEPPYYFALSYCWGNPSRWRVITVDGKPIPVGTKLHAGLQQLRTENCLSLWIDAICINQNDEDETSAQISMQKSIYHNVDWVAVWIGPHLAGSEWVMSMLQNLDLSRRPSFKDISEPWTPTSKQLWEHKPGIDAFFRRSFWGRVWIIQEIASASRIRFFCGHDDVDWRGLELLIHILEQRLEYNCLGLWYVQHLMSTRRFQIEENALGLLEALSGIPETNASKFDDKVFAFLGLTFDGQRFVNTPNYRLSKPQLFFELTKSAIRAKISLDIIFAAAPTMKMPGRLPSWVPDYVQYAQIREYQDILSDLSIYISGNDRRRRLGKVCRRWSTTGNSVVTRDTFGIAQGRYLCVSGFCIGKINGLGGLPGGTGPPLHSDSSKVKIDESSRESEADVSRSCLLYYEHSDYEEQVLRRYMLRFLRKLDGSSSSEIVKWRDGNKDFMIRGRRLGRYMTPSFWDLMADGGPMLVTSTLIIGVTTFFPQLVLSMLPHFAGLCCFLVWTLMVAPAKIDKNSALKSLNTLVAERMRLMTTEEGHLGWAHPAAGISDQIFLLTGCTLTAILRPSVDYPNTYTVVGHAYLNGVMSNEIWQNLRDDQFQQVVIS